MGKELKIDLGNTKGITRAIDALGRVVLPKEFREELNLKKEDRVEIFLLENGLYITAKK